MNIKFEYLSYCLKINEMDEEEKLHYQHLSETLYRVETGNYEYRLLLRCREHARLAFLQLRRDVFQKLELLHKKLLELIASELKQFVTIMHEYNQQCYTATTIMDGIFPLDIVVPDELFSYDNKCRSCGLVHGQDQDDCPAHATTDDAGKVTDDANDCDIIEIFSHDAVAKNAADSLISFEEMLHDDDDDAPVDGAWVIEGASSVPTASSHTAGVVVAKNYNNEKVGADKSHARTVAEDVQLLKLD